MLLTIIIINCKSTEVCSSFRQRRQMRSSGEDWLRHCSEEKVKITSKSSINTVGLKHLTSWSNNLLMSSERQDLILQSWWVYLRQVCWLQRGAGVSGERERERKREREEPSEKHQRNLPAENSTPPKPLQNTSENDGQPRQIHPHWQLEKWNKIYQRLLLFIEQRIFSGTVSDKRKKPQTETHVSNLQTQWPSTRDWKRSL